MTKNVEAAAHKALAELEEGGVTKYHRRMLMTAGLGFFTDAYDLFIIGVALALIKVEWHPSTLAISLIASTALLASALGAVSFGWVADKLGRRRIYGLEALLLAGGAIASAFSPGIWWLIAFRFVLGFGVGGDYPVSATIMSEYSARRSRGRMVATVFSMQAVGLIVGPLVAVLLLATGMSHDLAWRLMLGLGALPALAALYLRRQVHETAHFALAAGDHEHALNSARRAAGTSAANFKVAPLKIKPPASNSFRNLLNNPKLRRSLIGAASAWFLLDFAFYGNTISSPLVLKLLSPRSSLIVTTLETLGIFVVAALPGYLLAIRRIDIRGRKTIQSKGFLVMALTFGIIGFWPGLTTMVVPFLALYGISYFFTQYGPNTTTFVYPTELFPVRSRATGHGIAAAAGKIGAFIGTFLFPIMLSSFQLAGTERVVAVVCLLGLIVTHLFLPETNQASLTTLADQPIRKPSLAKRLKGQPNQAQKVPELD